MGVLFGCRASMFGHGRAWIVRDEWRLSKKNKNQIQILFFILASGVESRVSSSGFHVWPWACMDCPGRVGGDLSKNKKEIKSKFFFFIFGRVGCRVSNVVGHTCLAMAVHGLSGTSGWRPLEKKENQIQILFFIFLANSQVAWAYMTVHGWVWGRVFGGGVSKKKKLNPNSFFLFFGVGSRVSGVVGHPCLAMAVHGLSGTSGGDSQKEKKQKSNPNSFFLFLGVSGLGCRRASMFSHVRAWIVRDGGKKSDLFICWALRLDECSDADVLGPRVGRAGGKVDVVAPGSNAPVAGAVGVDGLVGGGPALAANVVG